MNILVFVSGFLLILAFFTHGIYERGVQSFYLKKSYQSHQHLSRKINNKYIGDIYAKTIKGGKNDTKKSFASLSNTPVENKQKDKKRKKLSFIRLNIYPLSQENSDNSIFFTRILKNFITQRYASSLFLKDLSVDHFVKTFIHTLQLTQKKLIKEHTSHDLQLEKLNFHNKSIQLVYYKMLKGTKTYDYGKNIGYPSLLDFIDIESSQHTKQIPLAYCHKELLSALFTPKIAQEIFKKEKVNEEKKTFVPIEKIDLETILLSHHFLHLSEVMPKLSFPKRAPNKSKKVILTEIDPQTNIQIKQCFNKQF